MHKPADYFSEFDSEKTVFSIAQAIKKNGHNVSLVEADEDLYAYFKSHKTDIVFNIAEGKGSNLRESYVPAILDILNVPYTGSGVTTLALALNKALTKKIMLSENILTPNFQLFYKKHESLNPDLKFPLIVKPNREGSAKGISVSNVVYNEKRLYEEIEKILQLYKQEALVEEFIQGKELTVGILENGKTSILPILEIDFTNCAKSGEFFYSWRMKEYQGNVEMGLNPTFYCPARLGPQIEKTIKEVALKAHHALGCLDMSRTDIRLSCDNVPYVLEVNPLPGLDPDESNLTLMAKAAGMDYPDVINYIISSAISRYKKGEKTLERDCTLGARDTVTITNS
ncbi:MAG: ATP-grasp domain-containing protein [Candidatus Omnitrophota bacterium]|nr:ATP-grasp domain-containing protein [Candidatus Omnitrophota bacterium]